MPKPALLIDVDGPLNPFRATPTLRPAGYRTHRYRANEAITYRVWLNPAHGPALAALSEQFELMWATTWQQEANTWIGPKIGLPQLPVITFGAEPARPVPALDDGRDIHRKSETIAAAMSGRRFVWIDDEITDVDADYLSRRHYPSFSLYRIDPAVGLLDADFAAIGDLAGGGPKMSCGPDHAAMRRKLHVEKTARRAARSRPH
ncbi:MAG: hypothetical protein WKF57_06300 [Nakamurella sp.]